MSAASIATALLARCELMKTQGPTLPVSMPDIAFDPPSTHKYLEVADFTNQPAWQGITSGRMDQGLLQVTVVWPKGEGIINPKAAADAVMAHFPKGLRLYSGAARVTVSEEPWAASPLLEDAQTRIPVTIAWKASA